MIVCSCNVLSDKAVREVCNAECKPRSTGEVYRCLGCSPQCGRCALTIRAILREAGASCADACATCPGAVAAGGFLEAAE
jgi:bacterioferritin-associated ferredoxin